MDWEEEEEKGKLEKESKLAKRQINEERCKKQMEGYVAEQNGKQKEREDPE